jgi:hypothetical protein
MKLTPAHVKASRKHVGEINPSSVILARFSLPEFAALAVLLLAFIVRYYKTVNLCHKAFARVKAVMREIIFEPLDYDNQVSISPTFYLSPF